MSQRAPVRILASAVLAALCGVGGPLGTVVAYEGAARFAVAGPAAQGETEGSAPSLAPDPTSPHAVGGGLPGFPTGKAAGAGATPTLVPPASPRGGDPLPIEPSVDTRDPGTLRDRAPPAVAIVNRAPRRPRADRARGSRARPVAAR